MHRIIGLLLVIGFLLAMPGPARAQAAFDVTDVKIKYKFGDEIIFTARIQAASPIREAGLFFQPEGEQNARFETLVPAGDGAVQYRYAVQEGVLRPFVRINFWFQVILDSGEIGSSPRYYFEYADNRFTWQVVQDESLRIHWYDGDAGFGQAALDAGHAGLQAIQALIPVDATKPMDVYIYPSASDVQDALNLGGLTWVSGHASPDLGVVLVSILPGEGQAAELERQIPHELTHVYLYRLTGPAYNNLPTWLREGLAQLVEQSPNQDQDYFLSRVKQNWTPIPIADLCGLFPQDASGASLAYFESFSFTRYLHDTYGTSGLQALIQAYLDGSSCDQGATRALGLSISQLDVRWQQAVLGKKVGRVAFQNLLPYLVVLLAILGVPIWYFGRTLQRRKVHEPDKPK